MNPSFSRFAAILAFCLLPLVPATAQEKSVRPGINKPFENPDLKEFLQKFEGESREIAAHAKEIVAACKLRPGMAVADVGAGTGLFTRKFAAEVGDTGKVYAVDIAPAFLRHIEKTCEENKLKNVVTVQCDQFSTRLPKNSVDLVFICDTYHHFEFPQRTLQSIYDALRPGGRIILIDFHRIEGKSSEWVLGHVRAGQEVFVREITTADFKVVGEERILKENYFVRFEKKGEFKEGKLNLHVVPTPIKSYRLLAMSMDDDGFIWTGSIQRVVHCYHPKTGTVENIDLPYQATVSACICVGKKVYILGQTYPKLIVYDRASKKFSEVAYPSAKPDVWYGTEAIDGRHFFLFDRGSAGVIKWDSQADSGKVIAWPYKAPFPASGSYEPRDKAIWCKIWDFAKGQYQPLGIARLDLGKDEFTGWFPFPEDAAELKPFIDPATTFFIPATLRGKVVPFDFKEKRWCKFLDVPQYGKLFGFMGGPVEHKGRYYFSLSTYNGTETGCDGKPYHFNNALLEFDPQTRRFEFLTLEAKDAYYQIAYMLSAKGEFFATGSNIREADGKLNRGRKGEVVFWQTLKPKEKPTTDWPCWRGPKADGVADDRKLPIRWSQTENIRWSVKLPGWGTSSPVVYGDRVFVTSHVKEGKKALLTLCFDRDTGKELWRHDFGFGVDQRTHEKSNLAVNTPAVTGDAVYVAFGNADIARYSHDGKLVWVNRYMDRFGDPKMAWGYGLSPLVLEDSVLFPWNHHKGPCFLIGLDKKTGDISWKKERPIGTAHATPLLVEHHGRKEILVPGQNRLTAFDAKTHEELWRYGEGEGLFNGEIISSPVYGDGLVFLQLWRESKIHAIRMRGDGKPPETVWVSKKPGPVESSLLYYRGLVYAWMDNGVLVCLDGETGDELYRERLGAASNSSPIASDGHIFLSDNDGKTFVVKAGREFKLLATNPLGERITASPAITGNRLVYRTDSHLYCIGEAGGE